MLSVIGKSGRETLPFDFAVVGAGPAGLSAAIRLKQLVPRASVAVLEKGARCGAHSVSGCVLDPVALDELLPDWRRDAAAPVHTPVRAYTCHLLLPHGLRVRTPVPPPMRQRSASPRGPETFIVSLAQLCAYLARRAEALGVEVLPGFGADEVLFADRRRTRVAGVATRDVGIDRHGRHTRTYARGVEVAAPFTLFAEGCAGHLSQALLAHYTLDGTSIQDAAAKKGGSNSKKKKGFATGAAPLPQTYALGMKEVWRVRPEKHQPGLVRNTVGWPSDTRTYAGSFEYHHGADSLVFLGYAVGLDYRDPSLDPFAEFQRWKTAPHVRRLLAGGTCLQYAARTMTDGGIQALPAALAFPGGALAGEAAGFMTIARLKGVHTAMKSAMLAAECAADVIYRPSSPSSSSSSSSSAAVAVAAAQDAKTWKRYESEYHRRVKDSWLWREMYRTRNMRPAFHQLGRFLGGHGLLPFLGFSALDAYVTRGRLPFTWGHGTVEDRARTMPYAQVAAHAKQYPRPDGTTTLGRAQALALAGVQHTEDQPSHLHLRDAAAPLEVNHAVYGGVDQRYCPAGVYEYTTHRNPLTGKTRTAFAMHPSNCLHCKTCVVKDPTRNVTWTLPESGGGPNYTLA